MEPIVKEKPKLCIRQLDAISNLVAIAQPELEAKKLKRDLEEWRELVLHTHSLLTWERPYDPACLFGAISILFTILWYFEPTVLSMIGLLGLTIVIADFTAPTLIAKFFNTDSWCASKERRLEQLCRTLAYNKMMIIRRTTMFMNFRTEKPTMYYAVSIVVLVILSWLGHSFNNLLLSYFAVLSAAMFPGLSHKGFLSKLNPWRSEKKLE